MMHPTRKRRLWLVLGLVAASAVAAGLVTLALRENITYLYTPSQVYDGEASDQAVFRLGHSMLTDTFNVDVANDVNDPGAGTHKLSLLDAFVNHLLYRLVRIEAAVHTDLDKGGNDTGVLANGPLAYGAHTGIDQYLADCILCRFTLFIQVGPVHGLDEIHGMVVADELQAIGNRRDYVTGFDGGHESSPESVVIWMVYL